MGEGQLWTKLVIVLPSRKRSNTPGLEQVAFYRAMAPENFAVEGSEESPLTVERLMRIGKTPAYDKRREFEAKLKDLQDQTMGPMMETIKGYDTNTQSPTFEGGYNALISWYRQIIDSHDVAQELMSLA